LSGTVEIEKQTAWLKRSNEELRKSNEELRRENERLAELESKLDAVLPRFVSNSNRANSTDEN
jgi:cell division protein FtsB